MMKAPATKPTMTDDSVRLFGCSAVRLFACSPVRLFALASLAFLCCAGNAGAVGFQDPGLQYAKIRTDYNAVNEGTSANPITLVSPCMYPADDIPPNNPGPDGVLLVDNRCVHTPSVFSQSNYYQVNGGGSSSRFWVLSMNNEPWTATGLTGPLNSGPPNQSLPRSPPGYGIMGFAPIINYPAENFWRLHEVLNQSFSNPLGPGGIPFLAVGAADNRGNGGAIGTFNVAGQPHTVTFKDKLWDYNQGATRTTWLLSHFLVATAEWGGKQRMLFIHLFYDGIFYDRVHGSVGWLGFSEIDDNGFGTTGVDKGWNWPIQEAFWYPGADLAYMDAAAMSMPQVCNMNIPQFQYIGQEIAYRIDLQAAFRCASDQGFFQTPMPHASSVPLTGVHWGVELTGSVAIWTSVHNMRTSTSGSPLAPDGDPVDLRSTSRTDPPVAILSTGMDANEPEEQTSVAEIRAAFEASCDRVPGCTEANAWSVPGAWIPRRPPGGPAGTVRDIAELIQHTPNPGD